MKGFYKASDLFSNTYYFVDGRLIIIIAEKLHELNIKRLTVDNPLFDKYLQQAQAATPISENEFFKVLFNYWHIMALELGLTEKLGNSELAVKEVLEKIEK